MKTAIVGISECTSYSQDVVYNAVEKACEVCAFPDVKGKKILVKPNILSDAKPEDCITTHPEVLRSVIRLLKKKGATQLFCADSPGMQSPSFKGIICGLNQVCEEEGVTWVDFTQNPDTTKIDGTNQKLPLAHILKEVDLVFSVCKFKTHQLMYATGGVKNLFGLVPSLHKSSCHLKNPSRESFAKLIVGIHETVKPAFCIMDAVIGMEGPGPANGTPKAINRIIASESCFAVDIAQLTMMGYRQNDIPVINEARRRRILPTEISYPLLQPEEIKNFKRIEVSKKTNFIKSLIIPFFTRGLQKKKQQNETAPSFDSTKCIRCKKCVNICPAKALKLNKDNIIEIDKSKCIRCYCCHEMCPKDAIAIR